MGCSEVVSRDVEEALWLKSNKSKQGAVRRKGCDPDFQTFPLQVSLTRHDDPHRPDCLELNAYRGKKHGTEVQCP